MSERFVTWKELEKRVPMGLDQVHRLERLGLFPRRRRIGARKTAWLESEIEDWFRTRKIIGEKEDK